MTFKEKIDIILKANTLGVNSVFGMENYCKIGIGSIREYYKKGGEPGQKVIKKIKEELRISDDWWETGKGDIFKGASQKRGDLNEKEVPDYEMWTLLKRNNEQFEKEIDRLWGLVTDLTDTLKAAHANKG